MQVKALKSVDATTAIASTWAGVSSVYSDNKETHKEPVFILEGFWLSSIIRVKNQLDSLLREPSALEW